MTVDKIRLGLVLVMALAAWSQPATAMDDSDKEAIRSLSNQAAADYEGHRYEAAKDKFSRAYEIAKVPKLAVWAARANAKLGRLVTAYELYRQALGLEPNDLWKGTVQQQAQKDAQEELDKLQPRLPKLTIVIEGSKTAEVTVKVDDLPIASGLLGIERYTDPGQRKIVGKRGDEVVTESVVLVEGEKKQVTLRFSKKSALTAAGPLDSERAGAQPNGPAPSKTTSEPLSSPVAEAPEHDSGLQHSDVQRTWGWLSLSIGAVGLALAGSSGVWLIAKHSDLQSKCPNNNDCHGQYTSDVNSFNKVRTVSLVGFAVGGVAAVTGVTLLLTAPKPKPKATVGLWLLPNSAGLTGSF